MPLPIFPIMFCFSGEKSGWIGGEEMCIVRHKLL